jgi:predicted MFS family arabinose efflux permease
MASPALDGREAGFARLCAVVALPFALGYSLSYLLRAVNAVVAPDMMRELGLGPGTLGLMTAAYLLAFSSFQPALGVLLDRFGPRRVQSALLTVAALGVLLFSFGRDTLSLARALIGLGFSGGLMASFTAIVLWFPAARVALANSLVMAFGALGVVVATRPADMLSQMIGWRALFWGLSAVTAAAAIYIFLAVPDRERRRESAPLRRQVAEIARIFRDPVFWRLAPLVFTTIGGYIAVQTLWVGGWLRDVAGMSREAAADLMMAMAIAFSVGMLAQGFIADRLLRRGIGVMATVMAALTLYAACELALILQWTGLTYPIWIVYGMTGSVAALAYPVLSEHFGKTLAGRSNTSLNLLMFASAFAFQSVIGWIVELWPADASTGVARYRPLGYQVAFTLLLATQVASVAWYWRSCVAAGRPSSRG